jgi:hypothetical protein
VKKVMKSPSVCKAERRLKEHGVRPLKDQRLARM